MRHGMVTVTAAAALALAAAGMSAPAAAQGTAPAGPDRATLADAPKAAVKAYLRCLRDCEAGDLRRCRASCGEETLAPGAVLPPEDKPGVDLTGTWEGQAVCGAASASGGTGGAGFVRTAPLLVLQDGSTFRMVYSEPWPEGEGRGGDRTAELLYEGVVQGTRGRLSAVAGACVGSSDYAAHEVVHISRIVVTGTAASFEAESGFLSSERPGSGNDAAELFRCKHAYRRVSAAAPEVPLCRAGGVPLEEVELERMAALLTEKRPPATGESPTPTQELPPSAHDLQPPPPPR